MKKLILLSSIIFGLFVAISCTKEPTPDPNFLGDHTIAQGIVLEYGTLKPVPNAKVILRECESEFLGGSYCFEIDSFFTGADGLYSFDFEHKESGNGAIIDNATYSYELRVAADNYFLNRSNKLFLKKEYINRDTAIMAPFAWIDFHLKNINNEVGDEIIIVGGVSGSHEVKETGDTLLTAKVLGANREIPLSWVTVIDDSRILYRDTLYISAFDTVKYEIFY